MNIDYKELALASNQKHGADDVRKVIHYCQLLLELEYGACKTEGGV